MRRFALVSLSIVLSAALPACSLDTSGSAPDIETFDDSGSPLSDSSIFPGDDSTTADTDLPDEGIDTTITDTGMPPVDTGMPPVDTGMPPVDTGMPPVDMGPTCDTTMCADSMGAKRFALVDRSKACPMGFTQTDVVEDKGGDACGCGCTVTANPTCPGAGDIPTKFGATNTCEGGAGLTLNSPGSDMCASVGGMGGGNLAVFAGATPPGPATGGSCSTSSTANKMGITNTLRLCEPTAGTCEKPICGGPFTECVEATGGACPAAYPNARKVGSDISLTCPACTCSIDAADCSGTIQFFGGPMCGSKVGDLAVDGSCVATGHGGTNVKTFKYKPDAVKGSCSPSFTSGPGTRSTTGARNFCCR